MFLIDTDVISELRKGSKANPNVRQFFALADRNGHALYPSVVTIASCAAGSSSCAIVAMCNRQSGWSRGSSLC